MVLGVVKIITMKNPHPTPLRNSRSAPADNFFLSLDTAPIVLRNKLHILSGIIKAAITKQHEHPLL